MKNYLKFIMALLFFAPVIFISCQSEESQAVENPDALTKSSVLTGLISRAAMNNTSNDNVIDSTSCYAIKLPVNLIVNDIPVTVSSQDDYDVVAEILTESSVNSDQIDYVFPITIINPGYEETIVQNQDEWNEAMQACDPNYVDLSIDCLSMVYPITVHSYNPDFQVENTLTFDNDSELYLFLYNLNISEFFTIDYPISGVNQNGDTVNYNNAGQLSEAINAAIAACDCANPEILTEDLIMYIPFANEAVDLTGNSAVNTLGDVTYVTDRSGNQNGALSFVTGEQMNILEVPGGPQSDFLQTGKFTVSLWFNRQNETPFNNTEQLMNTQSLSLFLGNADNNGEVFGPYVVNGGFPQIMYDNDWVTNGLMGDIGNWHHVVITFDGSILMLYRDGVIRNASVEAQLGTSLSWADWGGYFKGFMDDIRVYKRALTQAEVQVLYNMDGDINTCMH